MWKRIITFLLAISFIISMSACDSKTREDYIEEGDAYLQERNYGKAVEAYTSAIDLDDQNPETFISRAEAYLKMKGHYAEAVEDLEHAITLEQSLMDAYLELAEIYEKQEETKKLSNILHQALENVKEDDLETVLTFIDDRRQQLGNKKWLSIVTIDGKNQEKIYRLERNRLVTKLEKEKNRLEKAIMDYCWLRVPEKDWMFMFNSDHTGIDAPAVPSGANCFEYTIFYNLGEENSKSFDMSQLDSNLYIRFTNWQDENGDFLGDVDSPISMKNQKKIVLNGDTYTRYNTFEDILNDVYY